MKALVGALLILVFGACDFPPLDEINYTGTALAADADPVSEAEKFAAALSREVALDIVSHASRTDAERDGSATVSLKSTRYRKIVAHVIVYSRERQVRVMILPASATPDSEEVASAAVRTYQKLYGASEFKRWQRHAGLLGP